MRWSSKTEPMEGQQRVVNRFLFRPLTLSGQTRWFEFTKIIQTYTYDWLPTGHVVRKYWNDTTWWKQGFDVIELTPPASTAIRSASNTFKDCAFSNAISESDMCSPEPKFQSFR